VENNKDVFDKEVTDGINCLTIGAFGASGGASTLEESNMVVAGGNCSLNGFDIVGEEKFWTVTGDNVGALTFMDWDGDGQEELLVGSDDQSIRVFKGEELLHDIQEMSKLSFLTRFGLHRGVFGYALNNGTYGVYHGKKRLWRQKSKDRVTALLGLEFDIDAQLILAVGFASGAVLVRKHRTGDLIHEAKMSGGIVGMFFVDYR
jgi:Bardet-Biedl syndrome 2 protein